MIAFQFEVKGDLGHFKRPETNNNPLTHDIMPKTALIGMIGAVTGIERKEMKKFFPVLSDDLLYGVRLLAPVRKVSIGFTGHSAINPTRVKSPKRFEFLKQPHYLITLCLKNEKSEELFSNFEDSLKREDAVYEPVLGLHNCPAELKFVSEGLVGEEKEGVFSTKGFVPANGYVPIMNDTDIRIGFDYIPTYQNEDFWNIPKRNVDIIYPNYPTTLNVKGKYRTYTSNAIKEECVLI